MSNPHRIVIVGGGAGGLPLATALGERYGRGKDVQVTLVDRNSTHVWKPLLHEVAAGRMDADDHALDYLALAYWHRFRFKQGALRGLDRARREIELDAVTGPDGEEVLPPRKLPYDTLVLCLGSVSNDFGVPGAAIHPVSLDTLDDAERFHRRLLAACVRADGRAAQGEPAHVNVVIVGAGATGVELAAEIRQTTRAHAAYGLDHLDPWKDVRISLLEAYSRILPPLSDKVADAATQLLAKLDIDVHTNCKVTQIDADGVSTASGRHFPADLSVWAAGIMAPEVQRHLDGLEVNKANQLVVGETLLTTRDENIFAFGDCAAAPWVGHAKHAMLPPRAQVAHQQATMLVKSIKARLAGKPLPSFRFRDFGSLVSLGELSAVGNLMGRLVGGSLIIQGLIARLMYTSLYKMHQVSLHGLLRVVFDTIGRFLRERLEPRVKLH